MNLLLLPIPDEILLSYLLPQDIASLAKVNKACYKSFKPLIFKLVKKYLIKSQGFLTSTFFNYSPTFHDFKFFGLRYNRSSNLLEEALFYFFDDETSDIIDCYAAQILHRLNLLKEGGGRYASGGVHSSFHRGDLEMRTYLICEESEENQENEENDDDIYSFSINFVNAQKTWVYTHLESGFYITSTCCIIL